MGKAVLYDHMYLLYYYDKSILRVLELISGIVLLYLIFFMLACSSVHDLLCFSRNARQRGKIRNH